MRRAEIVIIGTGVVGASVAYHLAKRGVCDILLIERASCQGTGSTGAATGGIRAQFGTDINIKLSQYSLDFLRGCDFESGYDPKGYLFFTTDDRRMESLKSSAARQRELGVDVEIVDAAAIADLVPGLNCDDIIGGSFGSQDGFVDPLAILRGFTKGAVDGGARMLFGTEVNAITTTAGKVTAVETSEGTIECEAAVLCSGAWARTLAASAGVDLPVEGQRRQIVWGRTAEPLPSSMPMVIDAGNGFHFRPAVDFSGAAASDLTPDREVIFAWPDPAEPCSLSTEFDQAIIEPVHERAKQRASFFADVRIIHDRCRAGLYENTPDHHAILGGCDVEGLFLANGFSGHGVMHSPATGRALSEIILDGSSHFLDVSCLSIDRFKRGEMLHETSFI